MSSDTNAKLVMMANQIATFFATQKGADPAEAVAGHLKDFWDPRMRRQLFAVLDAGGEGLSPIARAGAESLRATA